MLDLHARNARELQLRIDAVRAFLSNIRGPAGASLDLQFLYSSNDCRAGIDAALFNATQDAVASAHGHPRYVKEDASSVTAMHPVSCTYEPGRVDDWLKSPTVPNGAVDAEVYAAY
jgi:hypothetical protein